MTQMPENNRAIHAALYASQPPSPEQRERFLTFLRDKYGAEVTLEWKRDGSVPRGFRLAVGQDVYDWSADGRLRQLKDALSGLHGKDAEVIPLIRDAIRTWTPRAMAEEVGMVATAGDGIATITGLEHAVYGEILLFPGGVRGMVQDLR